MKRLNTDEVKTIQVTILDIVSDFCEKNQIKYWLDTGTLLGAIRHKGYIPWDDDIDIGMLREDYEKFMKLFNQSNARYKFQCYENNPNFYVAFGKVLDTTTLLYEPDRNGSKSAVNIDVFVYDNAPDNDKLVQKMYNRRDKLSYMALFSRGTQILPNDSIIKKIEKTVLHALLLGVSPQKCVEKLVKNSKQYCNEKTKRVGNFTSASRIAVNKSVFKSFIDVEFEGKKYKAPIGYDEWLKDFYGDYMQLPPVEKRVTHHQYEAYLLDEKE